MTKKNQKKSKVEEHKSVANQCDYCRANGKCGRAMFDNYGTTCQGRSCVAWQCKAEDGEALEPSSDEARDCKHYSKPYGYCTNGKSKHFSHVCHKCSMFDAEGTAVAVVEAPSSKLQAPSSEAAVDAFRAQLANLAIAEGTAYRERVKLGVMLLQWEAFLGDGRGRGNDGEGLKGWLAENLPELGYKTAQSYKDQALKTVKMLGGGEMAKAALLGESQVTQPDGEVVEVDAKIIETRDDLYAHVDSRRKLEQAYFKFMAGGTSGGRPKAEPRPLPKLSKSDEAKAIWNQFLQQAVKSSLRDAIPLLPEKETQIAYDTLRDLANLLKEHAKEL